MVPKEKQEKAKNTGCFFNNNLSITVEDNKTPGNGM